MHEHIITGFEIRENVWPEMIRIMNDIVSTFSIERLRRGHKYNYESKYSQFYFCLT